MVFMKRKTGVFIRRRKALTTRSKRGPGRRVRVRARSLMNTHHFKYTSLFKNWLTIEMNGNDANFSHTFRLTDIQNYTELTALFDQYRINGCLFKLIPRQNTLHYQTAPGVAGSPPTLNTDFGGTNLFGTSNFGFPEICTVIDYDDDTNPANVQELMQYNNFKRTLAVRPHTRYLKPRIKVDATNTGILLTKKWIDCDNNGLKHYGIKGTISNVPSISPTGTSDHPVMYCDLEVVHYVSFKNTR